MKPLLKALLPKHLTVKPINYLGEIDRVGVTCSPSGASRVHFTLKEFPGKRFSMQNWSYKQGIVMMQKGDRVKFDYNPIDKTIAAKSFTNFDLD